jgi:hypothetical protein
LTAGQVVMIRREAHRQGWPSIARAQAFQFETMLRQKDVIGEWVPMSDPTPSTLCVNGQKWVNGLTWEMIDGRALLEVFAAHGLPSSLYTDRGSHYFHTPQADGPVDKDRLTQVGRALKSGRRAHSRLSTASSRTCVAASPAARMA